MSTNDVMPYIAADKMSALHLIRNVTCKKHEKDLYGSNLLTHIFRSMTNIGNRKRILFSTTDFISKLRSYTTTECYDQADTEASECL